MIRLGARCLIVEVFSIGCSIHALDIPEHLKYCRFELLKCTCF